MRYQKVAHLGCVGRNADLPTQVDNCSDVRNHFDLRDKYRYFACLLRARFEEHRNEKDMMKATQLLREAEEEFWQNQHPQPYIFPESPGGTSYERYECYKVSEATPQLLLKDQLCPYHMPLSSGYIFPGSRTFFSPLYINSALRFCSVLLAKQCLSVWYAAHLGS